MGLSGIVPLLSTKSTPDRACRFSKRMGGLVPAGLPPAAATERRAHKPLEASPARPSPPNFRNFLRWILFEFFATALCSAPVSIPASSHDQEPDACSVEALRHLTTRGLNHDGEAWRWSLLPPHSLLLISQPNNSSVCPQLSDLGGGAVESLIRNSAGILMIPSSFS